MKQLWHGHFVCRGIIRCYVNHMVNVMTLFSLIGFRFLYFFGAIYFRSDGTRWLIMVLLTSMHGLAKRRLFWHLYLRRTMPPTDNNRYLLIRFIKDRSIILTIYMAVCIFEWISTRYIHMESEPIQILSVAFILYIKIWARYNTTPCRNIQWHPIARKGAPWNIFKEFQDWRVFNNCRAVCNIAL